MEENEYVSKYLDLKILCISYFNILIKFGRSKEKVLEKEEFEDKIETVFATINETIRDKISLDLFKLEYLKCYLDLYENNHTYSTESLKVKIIDITFLYDRLLQDFYIIVFKLLDQMGLDVKIVIFQEIINMFNMPQSEHTLTLLNKECILIKSDEIDRIKFLIIIPNILLEESLKNRLNELKVKDSSVLIFSNKSINSEYNNEDYSIENDVWLKTSENVIPIELSNNEKLLTNIILAIRCWVNNFDPLPALIIGAKKNLEDELYDVSLDINKKILTVDPLNLSALFDIGYIYYTYFYQERDTYYPQAIDSFKKVVELDPNYAEAWYNLGLCYYGLEKDREAVVSFEKAIQLEPTNYKHWMWRGKCVYYLGKYFEAIKWFNQAITLEPDNPQVHNEKANALCYLKQYKEAFLEFDTAIRLKPEEPKYQKDKAYILKFLGQFKEALEAYDILIGLVPGNVEFKMEKGKALMELKKYSEALNIFEEIINIYPKWSLPWNYKSVALSYLNRNDEADDAMNKFNELRDQGN
jgi:tetratricopeptide (TPR) repeat protein